MSLSTGQTTRIIRTKESFNAVARHYDEIARSRRYIAPARLFGAVKEAANITERGYRVLDIGVGTGILSRHFRTANSQADLHGIDISQEMLRQCSYKLILNKSHCRDVQTEGIPYDDDSFDAVVSSGVFEFLPEPETVIRDMARVARPGGIVALTSQSATTASLWEALVNKSFDALFKFHKRGRSHSEERISTAIRDSGLDLMNKERFLAYKFLIRRFNYDLSVARKPETDAPAPRA